MKKVLISAFLSTLAGFAFAVPNDTYETAIELDSSLPGGQTDEVNNADATVSEDDRVAREGNYGKTVWYKFTAPVNGIVTFSTEGSVTTPRSGSPLDTVMCVCQVNEEQGYASYDNTLAFNDNNERYKTSAVRMAVETGQTYYIGVGTKEVGAGTEEYETGYIRLSWQYVRELANVRFNPQGGTVTLTSFSLLEGYTIRESLEILSKLSGETKSMPNPVRGGFEFLGWFTDPTGGIQVTVDDDYDKVKDYVVAYEDGEGGYLNLFAHWGFVSTATPQFQAFTKPQKFYGAFLTVDWGVVGSIEIRVTKMSLARNKRVTAKISARVTRYDNLKKYSATGVLTFNEDGSAQSNDIVFKFKDSSMSDDTMRLTVNADRTFSMKGSHYLVDAGQVGGALTSSSLTFAVPELREGFYAYHPPTPPAGLKFIKEAFPDLQTFSVISRGCKFSFPKATALSYKTVKLSGARRPQYVLNGLQSTNLNKSCLKLTYSYKSGCFKGSCKFYVTNGANYIANGGYGELTKPKMKRYSANVVGVVLNGKGFGMTTMKATQKYNWITQLY